MKLWAVLPETLYRGQSDSTLTGNVTVSYTTLEDEILTDTISVEVGKMPVVLLDFEPDEDGHLEQCAHFHWGQKSFVDSGMTEGYRGTVDSVEVITSGKYSGSPPPPPLRPLRLYRQLGLRCPRLRYLPGQRLYLLSVAQQRDPRV